MNIFTEWIFFNRIKFFERGYKYLFWIHNFIWKKKIFTEKNKIFVKIIHIFFLKIYIFFQIVLLHLNNHNNRCEFQPTICQSEIRNIYDYIKKHDVIKVNSQREINLSNYKSGKYEVGISDNAYMLMMQSLNREIKPI